jgi:hypothetical protein
MDRYKFIFGIDEHDNKFVDILKNDNKKNGTLHINDVEWVRYDDAKALEEENKRLKDQINKLSCQCIKIELGSCEWFKDMVCDAVVKALFDKPRSEVKPC